MARKYICFAGVFLIISTALAQELMVYPNAGQDAKTQAADEQACAEWARDKSGFDPAGLSKPGSSAKPDAAAEAGNSIVGDFRRAQELIDREAQLLERNVEGLDRYRRAFAACMEGRDYTVR